MVTLEDARRVIAAAEKKATEIGQPMNIAVAGDIVAHVRMDNAWIRSIDISQNGPTRHGLSTSLRKIWQPIHNPADSSSGFMHPIAARS